MYKIGYIIDDEIRIRRFVKQPVSPECMRGICKAFCPSLACTYQPLYEFERLLPFSCHQDTKNKLSGLYRKVENFSLFFRYCNLQYTYRAKTERVC